VRWTHRISTREPLEVWTNCTFVLAPHKSPSTATRTNCRSNADPLHVVPPSPFLASTPPSLVRSFSVAHQPFAALTVPGVYDSPSCLVPAAWVGCEACPKAYSKGVCGARAHT